MCFAELTIPEHLRAQRPASLGVAEHLLTKSRFISGWQCLKRLWLEQNRRDLLPEIGEVQQAVLNQGTAVGELARNLFPGGALMPIDIEKALRLTKSGKAPAVFEACVLAEGVLCRIDILRREGQQFDIIEVKSGTSAKKEHVPDVAVQRFVAEKAGFPVRKCHLMHLDSSYVRGAGLEFDKLFSIDDITKEVSEYLPSVPEMLGEQFSTLKEKGMPAICIGSHCHNPYDCPFIPFCWSHMPENSTKSVPRLSWEKFDRLYRGGVIAAADIPAGFALSPAQQRYVQAVRRGAPLHKKKELRLWLGKLRHPLSFFDLETFAPAVPRYEGTRPYQALPFQYSLHIQGKPKAKLQHREFLHEKDSDPSQALALSIVQDMPKDGSIVVYHQSFESGRFKELGKRFPELEGALKDISARLWDLEKPFEQGWYLDPRFEGSSSIKSVLPVMVRELSYKGLEVSDGREAQLAYQKMILQNDKSQKKPLLAYCRMDTLAMVRILDVLRRSI